MYQSKARVLLTLGVKLLPNQHVDVQLCDVPADVLLSMFCLMLSRVSVVIIPCSSCFLSPLQHILSSEVGASVQAVEKVLMGV